jgi:hypothetical protein
MDLFPQTQIGGLSVSRMVAGSNWFLGFSHQTAAKTHWIVQYQSAAKVADVLEVFLAQGINVTMGTSPLLSQAIAHAQQRVGHKMHLIATPNFELTPGGPDYDVAARAFDECVQLGATFCWPHQCVTDSLYDGLTRSIRHMDRLCHMIRQRGMIPGLSSHHPEVIRAADRTNLDVASYITIYNAAGFLMPVEIDWVRKVIHEAAKPVTTIKPMAAGRLMPYVGLPFVWSTLRDCDLVTVGTLTPDEAREVVEISLACLQRRTPDLELQTTRSKKSLLDD